MAVFGKPKGHSSGIKKLTKKSEKSKGSKHDKKSSPEGLPTSKNLDAPEASAEVELISDARAAELNEMDMLRADNNHLKRLLEQLESKNTRKSLTSSNVFFTPPRPPSEDKSEEIAQLTIEILRKDNAIRELENKHEIEKLDMIQEYEAAARTLSDELRQYQFLAKKYEDDLNKKQSALSMMELKVMELEESYQSMLAVPEVESDRIESAEELLKRNTELQHLLTSAKEALQRKTSEYMSLSEEIDTLKEKDIAMDATQLEEAINMHKEHAEEMQRRLNYLGNEMKDLRGQLDQAQLESFEKTEKIFILETTVKDLQEALKDYSAASLEGNELVVLDAKLREKDAALWDLQSRLFDETVWREKLEEKLRIEGVSTHVKSSTVKPTPESVRDQAETSHEKHPLQKEYVEMKMQISGLNLQVKKLEAENQSLKHSTQSYHPRALAISKEFILPLPSDGGSEIDHLKVEVQLKDMALQQLSLKNEELLMRLNAMEQIENSKEVEILVDETNVLHDRLTNTKQEIDTLIRERNSMEAENKALREAKKFTEEEAESMQKRFQASQNVTKESTRHFKQDNEALAEIVGHAFTDVDRLQTQLNDEKKRNLITTAQYDDELRALRDRALKNQGLAANLFGKADSFSDDVSNSPEKTRESESKDQQKEAPHYKEEPYSHYPYANWSENLAGMKNPTDTSPNYFVSALPGEKHATHSPMRITVYNDPRNSPVEEDHPFISPDSKCLDRKFVNWSPEVVTQPIVFRELGFAKNEMVGNKHSQRQPSSFMPTLHDPIITRTAHRSGDAYSEKKSSYMPFEPKQSSAYPTKGEDSFSIPLNGVLQGPMLNSQHLVGTLPASIAHGNVGTVASGSVPLPNIPLGLMASTTETKHTDSPIGKYMVEKLEMGKPEVLENHNVYDTVDFT
ncbi:hypothetical protein IE077_002652 [Cardiosporidium cionae]|uniref:Uncharacterized protein n=1 Tax=Cardiosporidium cionae TaxID=476202 RepID=A0ABQ7JFH6_9APIC|nr:hypothetical protein IE077_002652 [Cardiosporidium cionae]|eukprot:KAF8822782.1 hypothetical protein IE077_002652 [Cardiosporidium cionae]